MFFKDTPREKIDELLTRQPEYMKQFRDVIYMLPEGPFRDGIASVKYEFDDGIQVYIECIDFLNYKDVNCYSQE